MTRRAPSARAAEIGSGLTSAPSISQRPPIRLRREDSRQRIGRRHRLAEAAAGQPDFMAGADLGGDRGQPQRQVGEGRVAERVIEPVGEPAAADQSGAAELEIEIAEHAPARQLPRPVLENVELSRRVVAADHGADRGAGDHVRPDAMGVERAQHADMGKAARGAAAQCQPDREARSVRGAATGSSDVAADMAVARCPSARPLLRARIADSRRSGSAQSLIASADCDASHRVRRNVEASAIMPRSCTEFAPTQLPAQRSASSAARRALHRKPRLRHHGIIVVVAGALDRPHRAGVEEAVLDEALVDIDADHLAEHHMAVGRAGLRSRRARPSSPTGIRARRARRRPAAGARGARAPAPGRRSPSR